MSSWNGKLLCVKDFKFCGATLTKGKEYLVKNGVFRYDKDHISGVYSSYNDFVDRNISMADYLIEVSLDGHKSRQESDWNIEQSKLAKYITVNNYITIAMPIDTPIGISFKHPDDEYDEEIGQALALKRMLETR